MSDFLLQLEWDEISNLLAEEDELEDSVSISDKQDEPSRFVFYDTNSANKFIADMENDATKKKTKSDMNQFRSYLKCVGESRQIEHIPVAELDTIFGNFLLGARKGKDKKEYEPSTLRGFMSSFDRYLVQARYPHRVLKNVLFPHSNAALIAKQKELKSKGFGNKPNEAAELTDFDIAELFSEGIMGLHSPPAVINMLHLNFSLVLGMRGGKEQRDPKWGDIEIGKDEDGDEYLVHQKERTTKTRTGQNLNDIRKFKPKAWNTDDKAMCPVAAYRLYATKRPALMSNPEDPFFLAINTPTPTEGQNWFKASPMGINKIYGLTKSMRMQCPTIDSNRKITNHSVRKHLVQKCVDLNLPPTETVQITGHKNLQSVNNYSKLNETKQKAISKAINKNVTPLREIQSKTLSQPGTIMYGQQGTTYDQPGTMFGQEGNMYCQPEQKSYNQNALLSYFGNTTITGGTFTFYSKNTSPCKSSQKGVCDSPPRKRFRRIVSSDSD